MTYSQIGLPAANFYHYYTPFYEMFITAYFPLHSPASHGQIMHATVASFLFVVSPAFSHIILYPSLYLSFSLFGLCVVAIVLLLLFCSSSLSHTLRGYRRSCHLLHSIIPLSPHKLFHIDQHIVLVPTMHTFYVL